MKEVLQKSVLLLFAIFSFGLTSLFAQVPQAINFQAIARDGDSNPMVNTNIQIRLSVLDETPEGTVVYQELRALQTNAYGSFSFQIGVGANFVTIGTMEEIEWENGSKFLKIDYDPTNTFTFNLTLGTIEFVTVPYAFAAETVVFIDATGAVDGDVLVYNEVTGKFEPGQVTAGSVTWDNVQDKPDFATVATSGDYNDLLNTPTLSANGNIQAVTRTELDELIPQVGELAYNTTDEVILMWNGTNWIQLSDNCFPQPTIANAGPNQTISSTETNVTLAANTPIEGIGTWSILSGVGGAFVDIHNATTTFTGTNCTNYVLQWVIATACTQSADNVNISFSVIPTTANAGADIYSPNQVTVTLSGNNPTVGAGVWSIVSGSGGSFSNPNNYNSNFTGNDNEAYILQWTTSTSCNTSSDQMKIYLGNVVGQYIN
ncbi:MAG: hypothetical protein EOM05_11890, partial [Clostridia bacterium]|nr:hypothetical protein [Clostridia bacterium]